MNNDNIDKYHHVNKPVYDFIKKESFVLDVGCWDGSLGAALIKNKDCVVDGIDNDKQALKVAQSNGYSKVYDIDLDNLDNLEIQSKKYDFIIFADILEHIRHPQKVITHYRKLLKKNGSIIISLPNIAFLLYRLKLLFGKFDYKTVGVMDNTHIKFYTLKTMRMLIDDAGLQAKQVLKYNEVPPKFFLLQVLKEIFPSLFTLQFVFLLGSKE